MTIRLPPTTRMITFIATTICFRGIFQQFNLLSAITTGTSRLAAVADNALAQEEIQNDSSSVTPEMVPRSSSSSSFHSKPLQVIREYQQFHSESILLKEYENGGISNRTFVLGFYACPDSAGNRLHEFFNSFILAVVMNFTITWKFFDDMTCRSVGSRAPVHWCRGLDIYNSIKGCEELIHRAPWIASFDDFALRLNLTFGKRDKLRDYYSPEHVVMDPRSGEPFRTIPNGNKVWLPKERNMPLDCHEQGQRWADSMDVASKKRLDDLYSLGTYYLYGLLFHEIFPFSDSIKPSLDLITSDSSRPPHVSIVLHSRHYKDHINGTDTFYERKCIQNITRQHEIKGTNLDNCKIYLMSDRNTTLTDLSEYISQVNQVHTSHCTS
jgi:hypothetical protein